VQVECLGADAVELLKPTLGETPEAFNAVDMTVASDELVRAVIDSEVLRVSDIYKAIVAAPPVTVDDRFRRDATANNGLQSSLFAVRYNLGVDAAVALEDTKDDGFTRRSTPALAAHATSAEVRLINFDFTLREGRSALALLGNALPDFEKDHGDGLTRQPRQLSSSAGRQIERKVAQHSQKFTLANFGTSVVAI